MTIQERLEFIRAGYTRADIEAFESGAQDQQPTAQDQQPTVQDQQPTAQDQQPTAQEQESETPAWASALKASIDVLTKVTQTRNALLDDMGDAADTASKAQAALATYLTGKEKN